MNLRNRTIYQSDNLPILRGVNSETVDLIATDPPFNKGRDFHATPESLAAGASFTDRWRWEEDVHPDWTKQIKDDWPAAWAVIDWTRMTHSDAMGAFLCFMGVRLMEMHRVLKPTGSLWLHCDDTAAAYLTTLLDAIFGKQQQRAIITWKRFTGAKGTKGDAKTFARNTDTILYYAKDEEHVYHPQFLPLSEAGLRGYKFDDGDGKGPYSKRDVSNPGGGGYEYDLGFGEKRSTRGYGMPKETALRWLAEGRLVVEPGKVPRRKLYLSETNGAPMSNLWTDIGMLQGEANESTGYPTQKPVALYQRIIRASSNPGDFVLDPFCGCATTPVAAEKEGRQWAGIDYWDKALEVVQERVEKECANLFGGDVHLQTTPPVRSDAGEVAAPPLRSKKRRLRQPVPAGDVTDRDEIRRLLIEQTGGACEGCDRIYTDPRIWHLDHRLPRADGGHDGFSNRALLCPPCNLMKGHFRTMSWLRRENQKRGLMAEQTPVL